MPLSSQSTSSGYPAGYQAHLPPEADVNVKAMRAEAARVERERAAEAEAARKEEAEGSKPAK